MTILEMLTKDQNATHQQDGIVQELPVLPLRETIIFPHAVVPLRVGRTRSLQAVERALSTDRTIFMVAQRSNAEEISANDLYDVGTIGTIGQMLKLPDGSLQILVEGQARAKALEYIESDNSLTAKVQTVIVTVDKTVEVEALTRSVVGQFSKYVNLSKEVPSEAIPAAHNIGDPGQLADFVASSPDFNFEQRQQLLSTFNPIERLHLVSVLLNKQLEILELKSKIESEVQKGVEKSQRDFYLREQMKAIQRELGEADSQMTIAEELRRKVEEAGMPDEAREKALHEIQRLEQTPSASPESAVIRNYVDWLLALPWSKRTEDRLDIKEAAVILDEDHYGLTKVKERILEHLAVRKLAEKMRSPIICFVGPPGVGKTSLGRSIARAMGRKFVRMSLGGIRDEAEIRGHRRTYIGALPGRIIQGMRNAGSRNPVFMLDEIDKVGADFRGDPSAALLEALDPEQNHAFSDHYLEVPFDLSEVIFITTANMLDTIHPALLDRMEVITLPGYTEEDKVHIAQGYLLPKQLKEHGLTPEQMHLSEEALRLVIREYTKEAGVRNLERELATICRKVARRVAEGETRPAAIKRSDIERYLGPARFSYGTAEERDEVGVATGVAWTQFGGDLISVEVNTMDGRQELILTGQLGDVMQESAKAALSYARSRAAELGIEPGFFENHTIHIHVPAGSVPKDGPSAGITIATALVSALTGRPVRRDVAMTGEITLRGRVLPIGGLKEKILAAHRAGIKHFILPAKNRKDLNDVPAGVLRNVKLHFVEHVDEVLKLALLDDASSAAQAA